MFLSRLTPVARLVVIDLFGSFFHFPVWWYTTGFKRAVLWCGQALQYRWRAYAVGIWVRNFFVPMYGQYDLSGRLISILMRFIVLIGRLIGFFFESLLYAISLLLWLAAPIALVFLLLINLGVAWSPRFL